MIKLFYIFNQDHLLVAPPESEKTFSHFSVQNKYTTFIKMSISISISSICNCFKNVDIQNKYLQSHFNIFSNLKLQKKNLDKNLSSYNKTYLLALIAACDP